MKYEELSNKPELALIQEEVLDFWKREKILKSPWNSEPGRKWFSTTDRRFPPGNPTTELFWCPLSRT